jgi:poly(A) polymerase
MEYISTYVSDETSTENDSFETQEIEDILRNEFNLYESKEESIKRQEVLAKLNELVRNFIYKVGLKKYNEETAKLAGGKIFTFGSYRLGVHGPGSDIDVLCVAPRHIDRNEDFFGELLEILKANKEVTETEICAVKDAHVPLIKMKYCGIQIDLLFARLSLVSIDENLDNLEKDDFLKNCDAETVRSLNGFRVTDQILSLVPNKEHFRLTLKAIKLWAEKRGVYSNVMGYLGGVAWAILVANICKMFPKLKPNKLIKKFFEIYSIWDWTNPVKLNEIKRDAGFTCQESVWIQDSRNSFMPIITPCFPAINTTYNVRETTKRIILKEFDLARRVCSMINSVGQKKENVLEESNISQNSPLNKKLNWRDLFHEIDFFHYYSDYLEIDILATNQEDFKTWHGYVESKLRNLIKFLEDYVQIKVHPFPNEYKLKDIKFSFSSSFFFGIEFVDPNSIRAEAIRYNGNNLKLIDLRENVKKYVGSINESIRNQETMNVRITMKKNYELPSELFKNNRNGGSRLTDCSDYEELECSSYIKKRKQTTN